MEKTDLYLACIEVEPISAHKEGEKRFSTVGLFVTEQDAHNAIKLFRMVYKAKGIKFLENEEVEKISFPRYVSNTSFKKTYNTLDEFISADINIEQYVEYLGSEGIEELLKESDSKIDFKKQQDRKELDRIIGRMIRNYEYRLKLDQATGVCQKLLNEYKENIKFLEDLRDNKL